MRKFMPKPERTIYCTEETTPGFYSVFKETKRKPLKSFCSETSAAPSEPPNAFWQHWVKQMVFEDSHQQITTSKITVCLFFFLQIWLLFFFSGKKKIKTQKHKKQDVKNGVPPLPSWRTAASLLADNQDKETEQTSFLNIWHFVLNTTHKVASFVVKKKRKIQKTEAGTFRRALKTEKKFVTAVKRRRDAAAWTPGCIMPWCHFSLGQSALLHSPSSSWIHPDPSSPVSVKHGRSWPLTELTANS